MISEKQLIANRENARKGGPKTAEGKAVVSRNALKHGLTGKDLLVGNTKLTELEKFKEAFYKDLRPQGAVETMLADRIWSSAWRLNMIVGFESDYLNIHYRDKDFSQFTEEVRNRVARRRLLLRQEKFGNPLAILERYHTSNERRMYKALHELERLQSARKDEQPLGPTIVIDASINSTEVTRPICEGSITERSNP